MRKIFFLFLIVLSVGGFGVGLFFIFDAYPLVLPSRADDVGDRATVVEARTLPSARTRGERGPQLRSDARAVPIITAEHAVVVDGETGVILFGKAEQQRTPIASLTKLMTAIVVLEGNPDWDAHVVMTAKDERKGGTLFVRRGEVVTVRDLFFASLVGSANNATVALVRSTGRSEEAFVQSMNLTARQFGLLDTVFVEPTGLNAGNQSTAGDIVRLAWKAFQYPVIREAVTMPEYVFRTVNTRQRHRIQNTDTLLRTKDRSYVIVGGKTGYIDESGFCLVIEAERDGKRVIALVLGSKSQEDRFRDVHALIEWAFESYAWEERN